MKNKLFTVMILSATVLTLASCGKSTEDTIAKADTEAIIQETEEITETEEIAEETAPQKEQMQFDDLEPHEMYIANKCLSYYIPEQDRENDILQKKIFCNLNDSFIVDGKGEFKGVLYYRIQADESGINTIIEAKNLSDLPTTTNQNQTTQTNNDNNTNSNNEAPADDNIGFDGETLPDIPMEEGPAIADDDPALIEAAQEIGDQTIR